MPPPFMILSRLPSTINSCLPTYYMYPGTYVIVLA